MDPKQSKRHDMFQVDYRNITCTWVYRGNYVLKKKKRKQIRGWLQRSSQSWATPIRESRVSKAHGWTFRQKSGQSVDLLEINANGYNHS